MTSHPDVEALAFFAEDLLDPDEERSVAAHIETCATCATVLDDLTRVTRVLADAPAPALPRDVADLLDDRIADAVAARASDRETGTPSSPTASEPPEGTEGDDTADGTGAPEREHLAPVVPLTRRRGFGLPHLMAVAAATVFVVGGGAAILNGQMSGHEDSGAASPLLEESAPESAPDTAQSYSATSLSSGTVYTEDGLGDQAAEVAASARALEGSEGAGAQALPQLSPELQECVTGFESESGLRVTLVDEALYDGGGTPAPVWVLFTQDTKGAGVVVLDRSSCSGGAPVGDGVIAQRPL
ncbi:hypothetical protein ABZ635_23575 [Nocardiopsis sp. NPDC007018]|uniref:anti-sigma factor family protein n=1 Tax=Nocardiopsis sp. NPDC007018 TaxID=3155721 RepID=UPI0033D71209